MAGSHFIVQTNIFLLINVTAVTLGQCHRNVIQYISPDPYVLYPKYLRFGSNGFDVTSKSHCGGGGNELKTDRGDLINLFLSTKGVIQHPVRHQCMPTAEGWYEMLCAYVSST